MGGTRGGVAGWGPVEGNEAAGGTRRVVGSAAGRGADSLGGRVADSSAGLGTGPLTGPLGLAVGTVARIAVRELVGGERMGVGLATRDLGTVGDGVITRPSGAQPCLWSSGVVIQHIGRSFSTSGQEGE